MNVIEVIKDRRSYRSLKAADISAQMLEELSSAVSLAPSCFNNQPWRFVFVKSTEALKELHTALNKGNEWAMEGSMIVCVASQKESDCVIKNRDYFLFDTGMASAFLILAATDLGLVAHPIAGYDEAKAKQILGIPDELTLIAMIVLAKKADIINPILNEKQIKDEGTRPARLPFEKVIFIDKYGV